MSERPVTPYNLRLFAAAKQAMAPRPDPWALIDAHIREQRARGVDFGCWTPEADAKFRGGDLFARLGITTIVERVA